MDYPLLRCLNDWAGYGYLTDYLAYALGQYGIGILTACLAFRWCLPGECGRRSQDTVLLAAAAAVFAAGVTHVNDLFYYRPRPFLTVPGTFDLLGAHPSDSFPSEHAAVAFAIATVMGWESRAWGWITWLTALGISWARVYAGAHYPTDILGAVVVGFLVGWGLMELRFDLRPALERVRVHLPLHRRE